MAKSQTYRQPPLVAEGGTEGVSEATNVCRGAKQQKPGGTLPGRQHRCGLIRLGIVVTLCCATSVALAQTPSADPTTIPRDLVLGARLLDQRIADRSLVVGDTFDWNRFLAQSEATFPTSNPTAMLLVKLGYLSRLSSRAENFYASGIGGNIEKNPARIAYRIVRRPEETGGDINCNSINNFLLPPLAERLGFTTRQHIGMWTKSFKSGQHFVRTYESDDGFVAVVNYSEVTPLGYFRGGRHARSLAIARAAQETLGPSLGFYLGNQHLYSKSGALLLDALVLRANEGGSADFASYGDGSRRFQVGYPAGRGTFSHLRYLRISTPEEELETLGGGTPAGKRWSLYAGYIRLESRSPYPTYVIASTFNPTPGQPALQYSARAESNRQFVTHGGILSADYASRLVNRSGFQAALRASGYAYEDLENVRGIRDFDGRAPNFGTEVGVKTLTGRHFAADLYTPALLSASDGRLALYYTKEPPNLGEREVEDAVARDSRQRTEDALPSAPASFAFPTPQWTFKAGALVGRSLSGEPVTLSPAVSGALTWHGKNVTARLDARYLSRGQGTLLRGGSVQATVESTVRSRTRIIGSFTAGGGAHADPLQLRNSARPRLNTAGRLEVSLQQGL
jgi:hypothetical protein